MLQVFKYQRDTVTGMAKQTLLHFKQMVMKNQINFPCIATNMVLNDYKKAIQKLQSECKTDELPTVTIKGQDWYVCEVGGYGIELLSTDEFMLTTASFEDIDTIDDKINLNEAIYDAIVAQLIEDTRVAIKKNNGLNQISGGFVSVTVKEHQIGCLLVEVKSGVQSDVENDVQTEEMFLPLF